MKRTRQWLSQERKGRASEKPNGSAKASEASSSFDRRTIPWLSATASSAAPTAEAYATCRSSPWTNVSVLVVASIFALIVPRRMKPSSVAWIASTDSQTPATSPPCRRQSTRDVPCSTSAGSPQPSPPATAQSTGWTQRTAARQGSVADLKPPVIPADDVEPVVPVVLQRDDKIRDGVRVVPEERVVDKPRDVRVALLRHQPRHFHEDRNVPKRQDVGEPPLAHLVKDKDLVQQPKRLPKPLRRPQRHQERCKVDEPPVTHNP